MKPLVRLGQAAWLAEIGVDLHWLDVQSEAAAAPAAGRAAAAAEARPAAPASPPPGPSSAIAPADAAAMKSLLGRLKQPAGPVPSVGRPGVADQPPARPLDEEPAAGRADIASLAARIQACQSCPRHQQRLRAVPGAGQADHPDYLIVAEQPGIDDEVAGMPFQGDAGRLLDAMLAAVRLPRAASRYATYVVKCRALGGQQPGPEDIAACLPYLQREIALVRPRWILALGQVAARAVLGERADFDAARGIAQSCRLADGTEIPVWVTHQPASMLVRGALKPQAWRDLAAWAQAVRAAAQAAPGDAG
ncbi:uracil-DNA glycosylase [Castellaniella hirudinis]|uniref:uracil-DNA glycosylase n=1 Tax=Castellaniella hirudinis TaxID=1144617 RepID=UPI0039C0AA77